MLKAKWHNVLTFGQAHWVEIVTDACNTRHVGIRLKRRVGDAFGSTALGRCMQK